MLMEQQSLFGKETNNIYKNSILKKKDTIFCSGGG